LGGSTWAEEIDLVLRGTYLYRTKGVSLRGPTMSTTGSGFDSSEKVGKGGVV